MHACSKTEAEDTKKTSKLSNSKKTDNTVVKKETDQKTSNSIQAQHRRLKTVEFEQHQTRYS